MLFKSPCPSIFIDVVTLVLVLITLSKTEVLDFHIILKVHVVIKYKIKVVKAGISSI